MSIKVLVFESDAAFAGELRNELGKLGCSTCVVDDGSVGLQQASAEKPDLILLSIELPRMNGFSVCNKLKKDSSLKDVPLIIMSSESSDETFEQHRKLRTRAEDYVHKPIAFGELLQHIRTFVPMEAPAAAEGIDTDGIVIDDEIAIQQVEDDEEGTQIALRPEAAAAKPRAVDAEVDAFTESAFGRLQDAPATEQPRVKEANGAREPAAPSTRPGPSLRQSSRAAAASNDAELERLRSELARASTRTEEIEKELTTANERIARLHEDADSEAERMQRELDELKARLQQTAKGAGAVSSREFLDLREALNKKDKEILALKEAAGKKDREIFEARDKALVFERSQSEFEDKLLAKERELADSRERVDEQSTQLDDARRSAEDAKTKIARAHSEAEARAKEFADLQRKREDENAAHDATLASLRSEHAKTVEVFEQERDLAAQDAEGRYRAALAEAEARHRGELEQSESLRLADRDQASQERDAAVAQTVADGEKAQAEALAAREKDLRAESDAKLASLYRAHQDELGRVKADLNKQLDATRVDAAERLAVQETELQERHTEAVGRIEAKAAAELADARAAAEAQAASANERIAGLDRDLAAMSRARAELDDAKRAADATHEARSAELSGRVSELSSARDQLEKSLTEARDRIASIEVDLSAVRGELSDTRSRLDSESLRLGKAVVKWEADRRTLDRAKDALAVALAQIDEVEGRPFSE